jgi:hypothetical protein
MDLNKEGAVNFRVFGGYSTTPNSDIKTRHGFLYRCGHLSSLTPAGWEMIHLELKISTIFRLTTPDEASSLYAKQGQSSGGPGDIEIIEVPFHDNIFSKQNILNKYIEHAKRGSIVRCNTPIKIFICVGQR